MNVLIQGQHVTKIVDARNAKMATILGLQNLKREETTVRVWNQQSPIKIKRTNSLLER